MFSQVITKELQCNCKRKESIYFSLLGGSAIDLFAESVFPLENAAEQGKQNGRISFSDDKHG